MTHDPSSQSAVCPSRAQLADFRTGRLPPDASGEVFEHISTCHHCQTLLNKIAAEPTKAVVTPDSVDSRHHETIDWTRDSFVRVIDSVGDTPHEVATTVPVVRLGQYQLVRVLGQGGMGAVCLGYHRSLKKWVAVKLLPGEATNRPGTIARFKREMEAIGQLDHPNIVRATDAGEVDGVHYLVMELADGSDLNHLVRDERTLSIPTACEMVRQAATGLQYAHERGMVHRDVKPSNLILTRSGQVKVLDLGLALLAADRFAGGPLTGTGQVMGTLNYMAPEQWEAASKVDIRADIYSLGCTMYTLLTARAPFGGTEYGSALQKMAAHARAPIPRAASRRPDVPDELDDILTRMMAKFPADRFATPQEVVTALAPFAIGHDLESVVARLPALVLPDPPKDEPSTNSSPNLLPSTLAMSSARSKTDRWKTALFGLVLTGLIVTVAVLAFDRPGQRDNVGEQPAPKPVETTDEAPLPPRVWKPLEWHNLLDRPPTEFAWWNPLGQSSWHHDAGKRTLSVQSFGSNLLSLGTTTGGVGYKFVAGIRQTQWTGNVGMFFGARPDKAGGGIRYHSVQFRTGVGPQQDCAVWRSDCVMTPRPGIDPAFQTMQLAAAPVPAPDSKVHMMVVTVDKRGLGEVLWNGTPCPRLCTVPLNSQFKAEDYQGEFGLIFSSATATIVSAEFMPHQGAKP